MCVTWRYNQFFGAFIFFGSLSWVIPLACCVSPCILTCILQNLSRKKVLRVNILSKMFYNDKFHREAFARRGESRWSFENVFPFKFLHFDRIIYSAEICILRQNLKSIQVWFLTTATRRSTTTRFYRSKSGDLRIAICLPYEVILMLYKDNFSWKKIIKFSRSMRNPVSRLPVLFGNGPFPN